MSYVQMNETQINIEQIRYLILNMISKQQPNKQVYEIEDLLDKALQKATDNQDMQSLLMIANMLLAINSWKRGKDLLGIRLLEQGW